MSINRTLFGLHLRKHTNRLEVSTISGSEWVEIVQTHANGSDEIVGKITLNGIEDVADLYYTLGRVLASSANKLGP